MRVYTVFYRATADVNAAAEITLQENGRIVGIHMEADINSAIDNVEGMAELSFANAFQGETNNAIGPIGFCAWAQNFVTSGMSLTRSVFAMTGLSIQYKIGNRIYLNTGKLAGAQSADIHALIYAMPSGRR